MNSRGRWVLRAGELEDLRALAALDRRAFELLDGDDPYSYGAFRQFLDGVAVEPSWQGAGIGRAVTEALLERLKARRVPSVSVTVHPDNAAAHGLYRALGFEQDRSEPDYFGEGKPRVVLRRAGASG